MPTPQLHLVYSIMNDYSDLTSPIIAGFCFILLTCVSVTLLIKKKLPITDLFEFISKNDGWKMLLALNLFSGLILLFLAPTDISSFINAREEVKSDKLQFVEGRVTDYSPMPYEGHQYESFTVKNVEFEFSDYEEGIGGYHNAASHGGVIKDSLYVRISYYHTDFRNIILKLETE